MARGRSRPKETKASARFDLLSRVILAAFTTKRERELVLNPTLLIDVPGLAAPEEANPAGEQPTGDEAARANEHAFPEHHRNDPVGNGAANYRIARHEEEKMQRANEQKPTDPSRVLPEKFSMRAERFAEGFIVQGERDLHRAKSNDQAAHHYALDRQIIEHAGYVHKIGKQKRRAYDQHAHQHDDARPFQDEAESSHGEPKQFAFFKAEPTNPSEPHYHQLNLNVNTKQAFKNEGGGVHAGGDLQETGGREQSAPKWQRPKHNRF